MPVNDANCQLLDDVVTAVIWLSTLEKSCVSSLQMAKAVKVYRKLEGKPSEIKVLAMEVSQAVGAKHVEGWA